MTEKTEKVERVKLIDLSPLAKPDDVPTATPYVQQALMDPEVKKVFEALIAEIRLQLPGKP